MRAERGFTLLEIMVALAIAATGILAMAKLASDSLSRQSIALNRQLATWIAQNHLTDLRIRDDWPAPGETEGAATMAGRDFAWRRTVTATNDPDVRRVDLAVYEASGPDQEAGFVFGYVVRGVN